MKRRKKCLILAGVSLLMLTSSIAGCVSISAPEEPASSPTINDFTAAPGMITAGQPVTLSWDVSGATMVEIQPSIGTVGPSGSQQLSPAATTTYTLTATNAAGNRTSSATVTVTHPAAGKPDLVVTDIWVMAIVVYYKIKNQGAADAKGSYSNLRFNGALRGRDYVPELAVGEERTETFRDWRLSTTDVVPGEAPTFDFDVCADAESDVDESNEGNNCSSLSLPRDDL